MTSSRRSWRKAQKKKKAGRLEEAAARFGCKRCLADELLSAERCDAHQAATQEQQGRGLGNVDPAHGIIISPIEQTQAVIRGRELHAEEICRVERDVERAVWASRHGLEGNPIAPATRGILQLVEPLFQVSGFLEEIRDIDPP